VRQELIERPVRTDADLFRLWQELMGPGGFAQRSLWLLFLQPDGYPAKVIVPIDDIAEEPDPVIIRNLALIASEPDVEIGSVPMLISRPGRAGMTAADRRWAAALRADAPPEFLRWPMHLATRDRIQVFAPDDLIAAS
jgi:hypothetical protein